MGPSAIILAAGQSKRMKSDKVKVTMNTESPPGAVGVDSPRSERKPRKTWVQRNEELAGISGLKPSPPDKARTKVHMPDEKKGG